MAFKVLTLITRLDLGGAQQVALETLKRLPAKQYERWLVAGVGGLLDPEARQLKGVRVELWSSLKHRVSPFWDLVTLIKLVQFMRRLRPDLVHTHSSKAGFLGRMAARLAGVPRVIHTVHGWPFHPYQRPWTRWFYILLERAAVKWTSKMVAVSASTRRIGFEHGIGRPGQYTIIYPGTDLSGFAAGNNRLRAAIRKEFSFPQTAELIGMIACLKPQKKPSDFVRAAKRVIAVRPQARFLLIGDGVLRSKLEKEIKDEQLEGKLIMTGWRRDVDRLLAGMDIFALTSLWEGLPCVHAQAMASGVPIVATAVAGTQEAVIHRQTGLLVKPGDPKDMAKALLLLLSHPRMRTTMGLQGRKRAYRFGVEAMMADLLKLYSGLLSPAKGRK